MEHAGTWGSIDLERSVRPSWTCAAGLSSTKSVMSIPTSWSAPKVLLNFNERQYPHNDYKGTYGMSQLTFGIPIKSKDHGEKIIKAIESEKFQEIFEATKWSSFQTDYRMFSYFSPDFYKKF